MLNPPSPKPMPGAPQAIGPRANVAHIETCCYPGCKRDRFDSPDAPPFCGLHIIECAVFAAKHFERSSLTLEPFQPAQPVDDRDAVVYYVRIGDHIKIGTTKDLKQRLRSFQIDVAPQLLLAVEPGGFDVERTRHHQFADERVDARRELFNPSRRLLDHIERLSQSTTQS